MGFFTIGNLLTLGIVLLVLVLFRYSDRSKTPMDKLRNYGERLRDDLAAYVAEKEEAVKDYGISLKVQQDQARELMNRVHLTNEELADKAAAVARIDETLSSYGGTLEELVKMTARVQENLNRIRDESAFVEGVGKKVSDFKNMFGALEKGLGDLELRFERKNAEGLERAVESTLSAMKSTVSDLQANAETIERKVEDHREEINKIEKNRHANLERDMDVINKILKEAVEKAGSRADKMEEAALVKLRDQAQERVQRFQVQVEEKLKGYQEASKARIAEVQTIAKTHKEEWKNDHAEFETKQKALKEEWKKELREMNVLIHSSLEGADAKLEEYRKAQLEEYKRLDALAGDSGKLDTELRRYMQDTENKVRQDFSRFERESAESRQAAAAEFNAALSALRSDITGVEKELATLKNQAYENVSEKLQVFEDDFFADIARRSEEIDKRLGEWQESMDANLASLAEESVEERRKIENTFADELKNRLGDEDERLVSELEHLKAEAGAFEESIRNQMAQADESLASLREQLKGDLEEARSAAAAAVKTELGRFSLSMADTLKQRQRELEEDIKGVSDQAEAKSGEIEELMEGSRASVEEWQAKFSSQIREADTVMEEFRRKFRELGSESEDRIGSLKQAIEDVREEAAVHRNEIFVHTEEQAKLLDSAIKDADRRIKEFLNQTKVFDQAEAQKRDLERKIEDLKGDLDGLDQRRAEAAEMETQFVKIKRLTEDVNAKMVSFLAEKRRIEIMEKDFNSLTQISQAVREKLTQVSDSNDTLQAVQLRIRALEDALSDVEEKYQRVEKKNQVLEETNKGIDDNFEAIQKTEKALDLFKDELLRVGDTQDSIRGSIEKLAAEHEKIQVVTEKTASLNELLSTLEDRIEKMQDAREWLARMEKRFDEIKEFVQGQIKNISPKGGKSAAKARSGGIPLAVRENASKLKRQGWTVEEIAANLRLSIGEVELILEVGPKD
jgi:chromosome segregation ATPase